jgi:predicted nuclease of predicted toxin-antitoxin system
LTLRLLADENFPAEAVAHLRKRGHDVAWVRSDDPGAADRVVLERARREERLLLTFDKDFGELAFRFGLPATSGIVLFRIESASPGALTQRLTEVLEARDDWAGHFAVVEAHRLRLVALPGPGTEQG